MKVVSLSRVGTLQSFIRGDSAMNTWEIQNCERHHLLCNHGNGDLFTCEDTMLLSRVNIHVFARKLALFHWFVHNKALSFSSREVIGKKSEDRPKTSCLQLQFTTTSTKQFKCYCLEVSKIKEMKFIKGLISNSAIGFSVQDDFPEAC